MTAIEDMLRDRSRRPAYKPSSALADRVAAGIEGEPEDRRPASPSTAAMALVGAVVIGGALLLTLAPGAKQAAPVAAREDPRTIVVDTTRELVQPRQTMMVREASMLKADAEAVWRELRASLRRM